MSDRVLAEIREELETIRRTAEHALELLTRLGAGFGPPSGVSPNSSALGVDRVRQVRDVLPHDLLSKFTIVDQGGGLVTIKAEWLGKPDWARVDGKVKQMGGRWIKDGKNSRWEIHVP